MEIKWGLFQDADVPKSCAPEPCRRLESSPPPLGAAPTSYPTLAVAIDVLVVNPELPPAVPTKCSTEGLHQHARLLVAAVASSASPAAALGVRSCRIGKVGHSRSTVPAGARMGWD
jgi:hypothetical protein